MIQIIRKVLQHKQNLSAVIVGQVIAAVGALFGLRLLTEFISPSVFGEYKLLLTAISLVIGVFIRPFIQFSMREYHDAKQHGALPQFIAHIRSLFRNYIVLVAAFVGTAVSLFLSRLMGMSALLIVLMLAVFALSSGVELERALLVNRNRQVQASLVSVARNWLIPIAIVVATVLISRSVVIMLFATSVVLASLFLLQRYMFLEAKSIAYKAPLHGGEEGMTPAAISYGLPLAAVGLLSWLVHESDRFFLSYYHSEYVVGIYSAAYGLVSAPFILVAGSMAQFLYPIVFKLSAAGESKKRMTVLKTMLIMSSVIGLLGVILVGVFDNQIVSIALGKSYREDAAGLLLWVAMGYGFLAISMSFDLAAYGEKRTVDIFVAYGIAAVTNVTLNIALIPDHGAKGAVIATFASLFCYLVAISLLFFYRERRRLSENIGAQIV